MAPTPVPTMTAVGVASPRAQGQAMSRTAMAWRNAWLSLKQLGSIAFGVAVKFEALEAVKFVPLEARLGLSHCVCVCVCLCVCVCMYMVRVCTKDAHVHT